MKIKIISPKKACAKTLAKYAPNENAFVQFKNAFVHFKNTLNPTESEENQKNTLKTFLEDAFYKPNYYINTKNKIDLVIAKGKDATDTVGVILEIKSTRNSAEMFSAERPNVKSFQELVLYSFREILDEKNTDLARCVISNGLDWFVFDAQDIYKYFADNTKLRKDYEIWKDGKKTGKTTEFFYEKILAPFIDALDAEMEVVYFNTNSLDVSKDTDMLPIYKICSPHFLLKMPLGADANALNETFYKELLHIIGLEEVKADGKTLICRKTVGVNEGALLENIISVLEDIDALDKLPNVSDFGNTPAEQLFEVGMELMIVWVNRILFLKLLEAQLLSYHKGDIAYSFLNLHTIKDFEDVYELFHQVLAVPVAERKPTVHKKYAKVPYLNSSLFDLTDLEKATIDIQRLRNKKKIAVFPKGVLPNKKTDVQELGLLEYLFRFLDAYDFGSDAGETTKSENRALINASVLGKVFEKINGYKDGAVFTPSFVTTNMCRERIRRVVVDKFNTEYGVTCEGLDDVQNLLAAKFKTAEVLKNNALVDSIRICDPSVGSGHFLVSALNELLLIKHELGLLANGAGKKLQGLEVSLQNDELVLLDEEGEPIRYAVGDNGRAARNVQEIQQCIFSEKQKIIENCLFGVDINPNSVKICRLRLWIELLKSMYYTGEGADMKLETLPNIDINIKAGNSLLSRFGLDDDISTALKDSKYTLDSYALLVSAYKDSRNKKEKSELLNAIEQIKADFKTDIYAKHSLKKRLNKNEGELEKLYTQIPVFEPTKKELEAKALKIKQLTKVIEKDALELKELKDGLIYKNAFEWRFEFPEILNHNGDFVGFDLVIGNPPYGVELPPNYQKMYEQKYGLGTTETAILFIQKGLDIARKDGHLAYILPKSYAYASNYERIRDKTAPHLEMLVDCGKVWTNVKIEVCIFALSKAICPPMYDSYKFHNEELTFLSRIDKTLIPKFGFFPNGLDEAEIDLGLKILGSCGVLNDVCVNIPGVPNQKYISATATDYIMIGGAEISRTEIRKPKGMIDKAYVEDFAGAFVVENSVLVQRIVSHLEQPIDHIKITACLPKPEHIGVYSLANTINQIVVKPNLDISNHTIWVLLNSKLVNWYVYRFIFGKAIRTIQFYNPVTSRLPVPKHLAGLSVPAGLSTEAEYDAWVYEIYGLDAREIALVEAGM